MEKSWCATHTSSFFVFLPPCILLFFSVLPWYDLMQLILSLFAFFKSSFRRQSSAFAQIEIWFSLFRTALAGC
jgi:hypothetical protein